MEGVGKDKSSIGGGSEAPNSKEHKISTDTPTTTTATNDTPGTDTPERIKALDISNNNTNNEDMAVDGEGAIEYEDKNQATWYVHMELTPSKIEK